MQLFFRTTSLIVLIGALAGCAMPGAVVPNTTTADELMQRMGKPTDTRTQPQGGELWDYARGPEGTETWRYEIDRNRIVRGVTQLLTEERLRQIVPGVTTDAAVRELLGRPRDSGVAGGETWWEWRVDLPPHLGVFIVRFDAKGVATGTNVLIDMFLDDRDV